MTLTRIAPPEQVRSGGFTGGVAVQAEAPEQDNSLLQLANSLSRFNPNLQRAGMTYHTNRVEDLRRTGGEEAEQLLANELAGFNSRQLGEFLESNEAARRYRDNPYILPNLQVHRGRKAADELALRMTEQGVNPADREAVEAFLAENRPGVDDPFFSRGFNEQLSRREAQWTQMQFQQNLEQADVERLEMGQREFDTVLEDTGDVAVAFAALAQLDGVSRSEATSIQMATAQRVADSGDTELLERLLTTPRGDATSLEKDTRLAASVGELRNRARIRQEQANRGAYIRSVDNLQTRIFEDRYASPALLEQDPEYAALPEEFKTQVRGSMLAYQREQRRDREAAAEQLRRDREADARAATAAAEEEALQAIDDMIASGATLAEIEQTPEYRGLSLSAETATRRRVRAAEQGGQTRAERAQREAFEEQAVAGLAAADVASIVRGDFPIWEDVPVQNPELGVDKTLTATARREAAVEALRETALGSDPWNLPEDQAPRYAQYARTLAQAGLRDPQLVQIMDSARGLLTTEVVTQAGNADDARRVFTVYRQLDAASRSTFVPDTRTRAVLDIVDQRMGRNPEADFATVLQSAVAQYELASDMRESFDEDFTRYEGQLNYTLTDPMTGREVNVARIDRWRGRDRSLRDDTNQELRAYAQEKFLEYRAANVGATEAGRLASQDVAAEFTVLNGRPLRLPPSRTGGVVTGPQQWAQAVDEALQAEAYELGLDDHTQLSIAHLDRGVYAIRRPDGTSRLVHASSIFAEAGDWLNFSIPRENLEAAREAGALPTEQ